MDSPILITPATITYTGTSASANANGGVDFSACTIVSMDGIFSADYTTYQIFLNITSTSVAALASWRLRSGGSDVATSTYDRQTYQGDGTTFSGSRSTSQSSMACGYFYTGAGNLDAFMVKTTIWRPFDSDITIFSNRNVSGYLQAYQWINAGRESGSTSYDGLSLIMGSNMTGYITIAGFGE